MNLGKVTKDGKEYILNQQPYITGDENFPYYTATATNGNQKFEITWFPSAEWLMYKEECEKEGTHCDEGWACDWKNPDEIEEIF